MGKIYQNGKIYGSNDMHAIFDDGGIELTKRPSIQFKGAYSKDDSTDNITEVNVIREMTQQEFDQLSSDEKQGLINVVDATDGFNNAFQPVIYSEEEREIGVWKDGKPLYKITLVNTADVSTSNSAWSSVSWLNEPSNVDKFINAEIHSVHEPNVSANFRFSLVNNHIVVASKESTIFLSTDTVTILYTKTTDQPGSGKWTSNGVPAIHYSEDEHIVGTWMDGATLYEKTLHVQPTGNVNDYTTFASISDINVVLSTQFFAKRYTNGFTYYYTGNGTSSPEAASLTQYKLGIRISNGNVQYYVSGYGTEITDIYVTIRYTKTS